MTLLHEGRSLGPELTIHPDHPLLQSQWVLLDRLICLPLLVLTARRLLGVLLLRRETLNLEILLRD
ncbi:hypothetical protein NITHO_6820002 [Nitrolancea hollandica Lb]|uniref:Uncharacterized protein n=1 Tax=Nitrolancea hollandica Lb TaxID=1129897 RepID=I4EMY1_9BACT|nr:hypothetical protein NITHO_6820002 [Nitrolancea hollandica Lb]